jgi:hypothetical protein
MKIAAQNRIKKSYLKLEEVSGFFIPPPDVVLELQVVINFEHN